MVTLIKLLGLVRIGLLSGEELEQGDDQNSPSHQQTRREAILEWSSTDGKHMHHNPHLLPPHCRELPKFVPGQAIAFAFLPFIEGADAANEVLHLLLTFHELCDYYTVAIVAQTHAEVASNPAFLRRECAGIVAIC